MFPTGLAVMRPVESRSDGVELIRTAQRERERENFQVGWTDLKKDHKTHCSCVNTCYTELSQFSSKPDHCCLTLVRGSVPVQWCVTASNRCVENWYTSDLWLAWFPAKTSFKANSYTQAMATIPSGIISSVTKQQGKYLTTHLPVEH